MSGDNAFDAARGATTPPSALDIGTLAVASLEATVNGVMICDARAPDCPIVFANRAFRDMTRYPEDEILGRNARFLQGPGTDRRTVAAIGRSLAAGEPAAVEILNYRRDGGELWLDLRINPVTDATGTVTHFVAIQTDVTRRRTAEALLHYAQRMQSVARFTASVAHDLANLVGIIKGFANFLAEDLDPASPLHPFATRIVAVSQRAMEITRRLLAFARDESGMQADALDVCRIVRSNIALLRAVCPPTATLAVEPGHGPLVVTGNETQISQILLNLCLNAFDALRGRAGTIRIDVAPVAAEPPDGATVTVGRREPGRAYCAIAVEDDGVGMDPATVERMFQPFFTTKGDSQGTGFGLTVVKSIVADLGGSYAVRSAVGRGTRFTIYLPLAAGAAG